MSKVYIAAPYPEMSLANSIANILRSYGITITSRWLTGEGVMIKEWARYDLDDVDAADILLAINPEQWKNQGTGGRHVELGYAIARSKRIILIGIRSNVFHLLDEVEVVETVDKAIQLILQ